LSLLLAAVAARGARAQCADGTPPPCGSRSAAVAARNSVAVLPFASRSADTADVYLAEGLAEELANQLASTGRLQLKALTTAAAQLRRTPDPVEAGKQLGVAWVVTGSVRRAGTQLLVNASLIKVGSAEQAWGARFPRTVADLFAVQAEVAESVTVAVVGRLAPAERRTLARAPTIDREAYRLYLLGKSLLARRTQLDVRRSVDAFERAVSRDPRFAAGWAGLAYARAVQHSWSPWIESISGDSILILAGVAAKRAIALDSLNAEAWAASAFHAMQRRDLWIAQAEFERSIALDSLKAETWHGYGQLYNHEKLYDFSRAAPLMRRALALDPTLRNTWRHLGMSARNAGRLEEAEALLDTALSFGPWEFALRNRADVRFRRGNGAGAIADLEEAYRLDSVPISGLRALYRIALGDSAPARDLFERTRTAADSARGVASFARLAIALGHRSEALLALERVRAIPDAIPFVNRCAPSTLCSPSLFTWITLQDPLFAPLRGDPRFERLWDETRPRVPWLSGVR
jgi:TolB-like protein/tetratricopeptide (TPR) repeat protein